MFVIQVASVKGRGGISTAIAHYERMFRDVGVRSTIVLRGPAVDALRAQGFDVIEAPSLITSPVSAALPIFSGLRAQLRERARGEPIVVLVHSDLALPFFKRLFPQARIVAVCHSDKFKHKRAADLIITLNRVQHAFISSHLPGKHVALLGNPYVPASSPAASAEGAPRINFVARFVPAKDPLALVRALSRTQAKAPVRFIGAGPLEAELRAAAAGLDATFPGWLAAPFNAFHRNDVLVLPSAWEGLPYLLQEALDHGVPTVASDIPGNRAALGDGAYGMLFPFGDEPALAACIDAALADIDALRAKAESGRAALAARYGAKPFWSALTRELDPVRASV